MSVGTAQCPLTTFSRNINDYGEPTDQEPVQMKREKA
jgi:hypothetical protein